jgi:hypothetical protein
MTRTVTTLSISLQALLGLSILDGTFAEGDMVVVDVKRVPEWLPQGGRIPRGVGSPPSNREGTACPSPPHKAIGDISLPRDAVPLQAGGDFGVLLLGSGYLEEL